VRRLATPSSKRTNRRRPWVLAAPHTKQKASSLRLSNLNFWPPPLHYVQGGLGGQVGEKAISYLAAVGAGQLDKVYEPP
jgi:hypothetical protein